MIIDGETTKLEKGDMVVFDEKAKTISFFKNNRQLLFSNGSSEIVLGLADDLGFLRLIQILSDTHGLGLPHVSEIELFPIDIRGRICLSYRF